MLMLTWSSRLAEVGIVSTLGRMRERLDLRRQRRGGHLRHHVARLQPAVAGQERRQAAERRIDEPIGPPLADRRELRERERRAGPRRARPARRGSCRRRRCRPSVGEDHRVVGGGVGLDRRASRRDEARARRARRRAPAARSASSRRPARGRSSRATALMALSCEQRAGCWRPTCAGRRSGRASWIRGVERMDRAAQRVDRQRRGDVGRAGEPLGAEQRQRGDRGRRLRAVDEREPFLRLRASTGVEPGARESASRPLEHVRVVADRRVAFADQHQREVRERREVAARADRAAARHDADARARLSSASSCSSVARRMPE